MEVPRLRKSVCKVVLLQNDEHGNFVPNVIYERRTKKRKVSAPLKPLEKSLRSMARAQVAFANTYFDKHNRSSRKRRDGWLTDFVSNVADAGRNGRKKLRIIRLAPK
jgi:hypothetical protein